MGGEDSSPCHRHASGFVNLSRRFELYSCASNKSQGLLALRVMLQPCCNARMSNLRSLTDKRACRFGSARLSAPPFSSRTAVQEGANLSFSAKMLNTRMGIEHFGGACLTKVEPSIMNYFGGSLPNTINMEPSFCLSA